VHGWRRLLDWVVTIAVAIAIVLVFETEVAKPYRIPSSSMEPTLHCAKPASWCESRFSDRVLVDRLLYRFESPKRGQIVVFRPPAAAARLGCPGSTFVKRLIGLPGELVSEHNGVVSVDGKALHEPYVDPTFRDNTTSGSWRVPAGSYFFMGDDRIHSCDSRTWGAVPRKDLVGPVQLTYWPPTRLSFH
jgi:signal peptidase I